MSWRNFFFTSVRTTDTLNARTDNDPEVSSFLTLSALSFPIVAGAIGIGWDVLQLVIKQDFIKSGWVAIGLSGIVVLAMWFDSYTALGSGTKRIAALLIGVLNTLILSAAALQISIASPIAP